MQKGMKQIEYGYWWNCAACGEENAYGLTEAEAEVYIREWEENNADEVAEGETGYGVCDWNYNVIAEENDEHIEEGECCWKCGAVATAETRTDRAKFLDALIDNATQKS